MSLGVTLVATSSAGSLETTGKRVLAGGAGITFGKIKDAGGSSNQRKIAKNCKG